MLVFKYKGDMETQKFTFRKKGIQVGEREIKSRGPPHLQSTYISLFSIPPAEAGIAHQLY